MIGFWLAAGGLLLVCVLVLGWGVLQSAPERREQAGKINKALYRERMTELAQQFARGEIDAGEKAALEAQHARRLLAEAEGSGEVAVAGKRPRGLFLLLVILLPALAAGLYAWLGSYRAVEHWQTLDAGQMPHGESSMRDALLLLRTRLQNDPDDAEGWYMLGRSWLSLDRPLEASQAFANARRIDPAQVDYLVALAQTLRMVDPENALPEVDRLLAEALRLAPEHESARILSAYRAMEQGRPAEALAGFEWLKARRAGDGASEPMLDGLIAQAKAALGAEPAPVAAASAPGATIQVTVSVAPELLAKVSPKARVFVFAKAEQGPPMPLAVVVLEAGQLPTTLELSDANAMNPAFKLSGYERVRLTARISGSGSVEPKAGDLQGESAGFVWKSAPRQSLQISEIVK